MSYKIYGIITLILIIGFVGILLIKFTYLGNFIDIAFEQEKIKEFCNEKGFTNFEVSGVSNNYINGENGKIYPYACVGRIKKEVIENREWKDISLEEGDVLTINPSFYGFDYVEFLNWNKN